MNQKNTNKPKLSNNIKNIANKGSSALQQVKDKVVASSGSINPALNPIAQTFLDAIILCRPHFMSINFAGLSHSFRCSLNSFSASASEMYLLLYT